ncbi:metallophosphoesterase [Tenacibaculum phage Larrie]|nr:metallophosphoesterase [Tenacibaculum phage Larrie]
MTKKSKSFRPRINTKQLRRAYENMTNGELRVLEIGDLHEPFCLDGYLQFCKRVYEIYNCNKVVFIGDIIDNHYSSYHETDPNGMGGLDELEFAINRISRWYKAFPEADVLIGNHDRMVSRKAQTSKIPRKWIKSYQEVLEVPKWNFCERIVYENVQYVHGEGGTARVKCRQDGMSTVQGHLHSDMYTYWMHGVNDKVFGKQIGCGIDFTKYAFNYAKAGRRPALGCGVTIGGHTTINVPYNPNL